MSAAEHLQGQLFDVPEPPVTDVSEWAQNDVATMWHASAEERLPAKSREETRPVRPQQYNSMHGHPYGFHAGTAWAAIERSTYKDQDHLHPLSVSGETALPPRDEIKYWSDDDANGGRTDATDAVRSGKNVFYKNTGEDRDSVSVRAPRENLSTWAEDVVRNPQDASYAERAAVRKGAELVYSRAGMYTRTPYEQWIKSAKDDTSPAQKVPLAPGLVGSEVDVAPEGVNAQSGAWERLVPSLVYPGKKPKTRKSPPQEETLF